MFIIVAIINSINFIDGIDGLAITIVILFITAFEFFVSQPIAYSNLSSILIGSLLPLYYFNFRKSYKIFLGDSGSLFLGGIVSIYVVYVLSNNYIIKSEFDLHKIVFIFSILVYPIIDITRIIFLRILNGKSPFQPDKKHLHHLLLKKTKQHSTTTLIIVSSSIFFIILSQIIF